MPASPPGASSRSFRARMGDRMEYATDPYEAAKGCDAVLVVTEWHEYRTPDFARLREVVRQRILFDGRNVIDARKATAAGFELEGISRGTALPTPAAPSPTPATA